MQLIVWRTIGKNPCNDPPVKISIAPKEPGTDVFPWVLPVERAREIFGHVVDQIVEEPMPINLALILE